MNNAEEAKSKPEDLRCQDCVLKEIGAGKDVCEKHGKTQIDWKCMFCCSIAVFHCFGTHYMCDKCHTGYANDGPAPKDCHGVNCPLGIAHPPASKNPRESNFALGCGICRSEKTNALKPSAVMQVMTAENLPKAHNQQANDAAPKRLNGVVYPEVEHEMPDFVIWSPEDILEAKLEEEHQARLRAIEAARQAKIHAEE